MFASAVLLFILVTGLPPFQLAKADDSLYKYIHSKKLDVFWSFWTNQLRRKDPAYEFDPDFKDLVTNMLLFNRSERLPLADIIGHPYLQGEIASDAELREELQLRRELMAAQQRA